MATTEEGFIAKVVWRPMYLHKPKKETNGKKNQSQSEICFK
jgi:hypothetical protein